MERITWGLQYFTVSITYHSGASMRSNIKSFDLNSLFKFFNKNYKYIFKENGLIKLQTYDVKIGFINCNTNLLMLKNNIANHINQGYTSFIIFCDSEEDFEKLRLSKS